LLVAPSPLLTSSAPDSEYRLITKSYATVICNIRPLE
jgi:hypothetical protein